jgi:hypothetical protein
MMTHSKYPRDPNQLGKLIVLYPQARLTSPDMVSAEIRTPILSTDV